MLIPGLPKINKAATAVTVLDVGTQWSCRRWQLYSHFVPDTVLRMWLSVVPARFLLCGARDGRITKYSYANADLIAFTCFEIRAQHALRYAPRV